jgi:hypothetical protein
MRFLYYVENVLILSLFLNENTVLILKKLEYEVWKYILYCYTFATNFNDMLMSDDFVVVKKLEVVNVHHNGMHLFL